MAQRFFIAIRPPGEIRDSLIDRMEALDGARWQDDDQLHLTLRFVGEADPRQVDDLMAALQSVSAPPFALAIAGVAIAQNHEANENRIIGKHSERDIPLAQVPEAAMNAARAQLASISKAEQVTRKADGSTLYEIKGKNSDGKTIELFVTPEGQVLGRE